MAGLEAEGDSSDASERKASARQTGGALAVGGPDGVGKTTFCDALGQGVLEHSQVLRIHHRPGVLPFRTRTEGPVTEPHKDPTYSRPVSLGKLLYLFADFRVGWFLKIRPFVRRGGWVIIERSWWDIAVDPRRYRLRVPTSLVRALGRLLPSPDLTIVLEAPADVILTRKAELPADELVRQMRAWRTMLPSRVRRIYLDASRPVPVLLEGAQSGIDVALTPERGRTWASIPPGSRPRWVLPTRPRQTARMAVGVHRSISSKGRASSAGLHFLAASGALKLLPKADPPEAVWDAVGRFVPAGGTIAVGRANHPGRYGVLLLDRQGNACAFAKVATTEGGRRRLAHEADSLTTFGTLLSPPVFAPQLLESGPGVLLLAPVRWQAQRQPWRLPEEVAFALGTFFGSRTRQGAGALTHGDVAPWNLFRTAQGWTLIDWEEARSGGPAFFDLFHFLTQAHVLLHHPSRRELTDGLGGEGWIGAATRAYARGAGLDASAARVFFRSYLDEPATWFEHSTREGRRGMPARRRSLRGLVP